MIRPLGSLRAAGATARACLAAVAIGTAPAAPDSTPVSAPDSSAPAPTVWVPLPVEEIDRPEQLDRESAGAGGNASAGALSLRCDVRNGRVAFRRAAVAHARGALRIGVETAQDAQGERAATVIASVRRAQVAAGRVGIGDGPPLLEEWIGTRRRSSRIPPVATRLPSFEAAGAASPSIEGAGLRGEWRSGSAALGAWALAGRFVESGERGARTAAGGARIARGGTTVHLGVGLARDPESGRVTAAASGVWTFRRGGRGVDPRGASVEALVADRGVSTVLAAWMTAGPLEMAGRWRRRAGEARAAAGEATAEGGPRGARLRVRMSGGPSGASGSVSRVEAECRLAAPVPASFRGGETRWAEPPPEGPSEAYARRERFWVLEAEVARSPGRTLSVTASRRERSLPSGWRAGSGFGGRLGLYSRRGRLEILVQATHAAAGGAAWGSALYAAGSTALRSWSRPGVWAAGRATLRLGGRWTAGGVVESREDGGRRGATAASFWIQRTLPAKAR
jgi:hypothetical protein